MQRVLDEAVVQARDLGHNWVGTEHLTLALLSAGGRPCANKSVALSGGPAGDKMGSDGDTFFYQQEG